MRQPGERTSADDAFRLDVRHLIGWHRRGDDEAPRGDDREIRRIVRDGYHRALQLVPPYPMTAGESASPAALAALLFCRTFKKHRVDPRDLHAQERYWGVVVRALDESLDIPA